MGHCKCQHPVYLPLFYIRRILFWWFLPQMNSGYVPRTWPTYWKQWGAVKIITLVKRCSDKTFHCCHMPILSSFLFFFFLDTLHYVTKQFCGSERHQNEPVISPFPLTSPYHFLDWGSSSAVVCISTNWLTVCRPNNDSPKDFNRPLPLLFSHMEALLILLLLLD